MSVLSFVKKRRLIKQLKANNNPETRNRLNELNKEIVMEIKDKANKKEMYKEKPSTQ